MSIFPVIVCIAKLESDYIEEFVKYHLALGFKRIYLYDNEDIPTYETLLFNYHDNIRIKHLPFNNYEKGVQYIALDDFIQNHMFVDNEITHVAHIDIDEFIVLKRHENISDFIKEYIVGDCQGIDINWRFFGSSGHTKKSQIPNTLRFTMCEKPGNMHIKTLFKKDYFLYFNSCHDVVFSQGYTKSTKNNIIEGPFNNDIDFETIQLNHYKCKTLPEFKCIRNRKRSDIVEREMPYENVEESFHLYNTNEIEDLTAKNFYENIIKNI